LLQTGRAGRAQQEFGSAVIIIIVVLASLRRVFTARRRIGPIDGGLGSSGVRRVLASAPLLISRGAVKLTGPHTQLTPTGQDGTCQPLPSCDSDSLVQTRERERIFFFFWKNFAWLLRSWLRYVAQENQIISALSFICLARLSPIGRIISASPLSLYICMQCVSYVFRRDNSECERKANRDKSITVIKNR
jgi:hypothetical protein